MNARPDPTQEEIRRECEKIRADRTVQVEERTLDRRRASRSGKVYKLRLSGVVVKAWDD